ncbi:hypothetical protein C8R46DRAFT_1223948 [Mycena filopes]|nr:hypothetical protein C8R46DRAFT_1223948 [Mycena filopes]
MPRASATRVVHRPAIRSTLLESFPACPSVQAVAPPTCPVFDTARTTHTHRALRLLHGWGFMRVARRGSTPPMKSTKPPRAAYWSGAGLRRLPSALLIAPAASPCPVAPAYTRRTPERHARRPLDEAVRGRRAGAVCAPRQCSSHRRGCACPGQQIPYAHRCTPPSTLRRRSTDNSSLFVVPISSDLPSSLLAFAGAGVPACMIISVVPWNMLLAPSYSVGGGPTVSSYWKQPLTPRNALPLLRAPRPHTYEFSTAVRVLHARIPRLVARHCPLGHADAAVTRSLLSQHGPILAPSFPPSSTGVCTSFPREACAQLTRLLARTHLPTDAFQGLYPRRRGRAYAPFPPSRSVCLPLLRWQMLRLAPRILDARPSLGTYSE